MMRITNSDQEVADGNLLLGCVKSIQDLRSCVTDLAASVKTFQSGNEYLNLRLNEISGIIQEIKSSSDVSELYNNVVFINEFYNILYIVFIIYCVFICILLFAKLNFIYIHIH
jgi:hypothetical protein